MFGVCRGKFAEGFNFDGDLCRILVIIGFPNLNINDPYVLLKKRYFAFLEGERG